MTGISTLGASLDQISRLKVQQNSIDILSTQIATGKKTQEFSGLGTDILRTQRARTDINSLEQYSTNIQNGQRRIELVTNTLEQIRSQANLVVNGLTVGVQEGDAPDLATLQQLAGDVYDFVVDLINAKDGDRFLLAGSDSSVRPIDDEGLFDSFLGTFLPDNDDITNPPLQASGFIGDWGNGTITTDEFIAAYQNVDENVLGYSETLVSGSTGEVSIRVDENSEFDYTVLGNTEGLKEIVIALGVLKNLPLPENSPGALNDPTATRPADDTPPFPSAEKQENFFQVFNEIRSTLFKAIDKVEQEEYRLNLVEAQTEIIQEQHKFQINTFKTTISEIEDVDLTEAVAQIQQAQISLQASFSVTSILSDLSLVNFLTR